MRRSKASSMALFILLSLLAACVAAQYKGAFDASSQLRSRQYTNASSTNVSYQSPSAPAFGSSQPASRPSIDAYGAFSDPAPSGFAGGVAPQGAQYSDSGPRVSRTMQYADPYAAVRASIASGQSNTGSVTPPTGGPPPPGYSSYGGYRGKPGSVLYAEDVT